MSSTMASRPTTTSSSSSTPILTTTHSLLRAYSLLTPAALLAHFTPSFTHHVLPSAMGMPSRDITAFSKHSAMITGIFSEFAMKPLSVIADEGQKSVVVHAKMEGVLKAVKDVPYENECVLMLWLEEVEGNTEGDEEVEGKGIELGEGEEGKVWKIREMKEYVDSAKALEMKRAMAEKMGKAGVDTMMNE